MCKNIAQGLNSSARKLCRSTFAISCFQGPLEPPNTELEPMPAKVAVYLRINRKRDRLKFRVLDARSSRFLILCYSIEKHEIYEDMFHIIQYLYIITYISFVTTKAHHLSNAQTNTRPRKPVCSCFSTPQNTLDIHSWTCTQNVRIHYLDYFAKYIVIYAGSGRIPQGTINNNDIPRLRRP